MDPQQSPAGAPPPPQPYGQGPVAGAAPWQAPAEEVGPAPGIRFAGHGGRLVAYIVDAIILGVAITIVSLVLGAVFITGVDADSVSGTAISAALVWILAIILVSILYFPWFWARGGQTPGMKMFRLRVVRDADGGPIGWGTAILRYIVFVFINSIVFGLPIGFVWILIDKRRRGWHDLIASTVVIEQP